MRDGKERNPGRGRARTIKPAKAFPWAAPASLWVAGLLCFIACASREGQAQDSTGQALAQIRGFQSGSLRGEIRFEEAGEEGLRVRAQMEGLAPNQSYAIHIHEFGSCESPEAAGDHFDPGKSGRHGMPDMPPETHHAGDLPNLRSDEAGKAAFEFTSKALGAGATTFSVIGRSVVVHAHPDDYQSQPAGGSGDRIACGVIRKTGK